MTKKLILIVMLFLTIELSATSNYLDTSSLVGNGIINDEPAFSALLSNAGGKIIDLKGMRIYLENPQLSNSESYPIKTPSGITVKNGSILLGTNVFFEVQASTILEDLTIDGPASDYCITERTPTSSTETVGAKYSLFNNVTVRYAGKSGFYLHGYHFLTKFEKCFAYSRKDNLGKNISTGYGFDIGKIDDPMLETNPSPEVTMVNCYSNGFAGGYTLNYTSAILISCAADNISGSPFAFYNSTIELLNSSAENFTSEILVHSSSVRVKGGHLYTSSYPFNSPGSNTYSFYSVGSGTQLAVLELNGQVLLNQSPNEMAAVRVFGQEPLDVTIKNLVYKNDSNCPKIRNFYYQSANSPSANLQKITHIGNSTTIVKWSGTATTTSAPFLLYNEQPDVNYLLPRKGVVRTVDWKEIGLQPVGSRTTIDMNIWNADGTLSRSITDVIIITGTGINTVMRNGSKILDLQIEAGQSIEFIVSTPGARSSSGLSIAIVLDLQ